ncbi:cytosolic acyl-CoA thioester hydrolase family protein [Chlamydia abortus]|uniref:Acyl-CoA thioesterase n=1 Tax=Paenibacillus residui TaxID=629724 RepID=A0ABW3DBA1_9BACL|nr:MULTISPECIES: acyl-CoA thioesterase [Paenibacillaceae]SHE10513.1 cytosolic acyl-CoA thioester hydrolase family protein [Chlamydia abortus]
MMNAKPVKQSRTVLSSYVLPPDTNNHHTLFGGKLMAYIDDVAARAAMRHSRRPVVTASTDSIDFLQPIRVDNEVSLEAFVTWAGRTSMEVFVKVLTEDLHTGERMVCATSFLTYVALGDDGRPTEVPKAIPETPQEKLLHDSAPARAEARSKRRIESKQLAETFGISFPWE